MTLVFIPPLIGTAEAEPVTYDLKGTLYVQVYKDPTTIAQALAHDHVVKAVGWSGTATWDSDDSSACAMDISLEVGKLQVDEKGLRERLGYDTFPSDGEREDIRKEMLGSKALEGDLHPEITWKLTSCDFGDTRTNVTGDMTIHGTTTSISLPMVVKADSVNFSAKGSTKIKTTQFGMEPYSAGFGALKNQDTMILVVSIHGTPQ